MTGADLSFGGVALIAFWAVLIAELVGDRSLYAAASLSLRFRWAVVFATFTIANATKAAVATLLAHAITQIQSHWTYLLSAAAFFIAAILIWLDESSEIVPPKGGRMAWSRGAFVCFCSFFLIEWGDPGQIAVAALVLKFQAPLAAWVGATLAFMLKGAVAIALGLQLRDRLPLRTLRILSSLSCCILGVLAVAQSVMS